MASLPLEGESEEKVALVAIGSQERIDRIAEVLAAPTCVAEPGTDANVTKLEFEDSAEDETNIIAFVKFGGGIQFDVHSQSGIDRPTELLDSRNVPQHPACLQERPDRSRQNVKFNKGGKLP